MFQAQRAANFEHFARMRLEGRSDLTYRAYDLLTTERLSMPVAHYLKMAGQITTHDPREPLIVLQHRFMKWGFPVMSLTAIETLLHEFWVYDRIKRRGKKNWPYRDPDEARALWYENEAAIAAASSPVSEPPQGSSSRTSMSRTRGE